MKSLYSIYGHRADVYALWTTAAATLITGLSLPVITFTELIFKKSTYSIISGVQSLFNGGEYVLAAVLFVFSVIFPILKLLTLLLLYFCGMDSKGRTKVVYRLSALGKWSMLDVYVVAMTIVIAKSSSLIKAQPRTGIYFFGVSVLLSIIVSSLIESLAKKRPTHVL